MKKLRWRSLQIKLKKITGHRFPQLLGKSRFTTKGDCLVKMFLGITEEPIDPFYIKRGAIGEFLVEHELTKMGVKVNHYDTKEENYDFYYIFIESLKVKTSVTSSL